jgi:hypothetical protein
MFDTGARSARCTIRVQTMGPHYMGSLVGDGGAAIALETVFPASRPAAQDEATLIYLRLTVAVCVEYNLLMRKYTG